MSQTNNKFNKKGFTLAEVLITLGIIGVVAALSIPTLVNFFQDKANEVAFKKMYSNLSNAIKEVTQENGGLAYQCFYVYPTISAKDTECKTFYDSVLNKMGASKECKNGVSSGCQPQYKNMDTVLSDGGETYATDCATSRGSHVSTKTSYILPDGSMILSYYSTSYLSGFYNSPLFIIDTNGFKRPNKWGYDVFVLAFYTKSDNPNNVYLSDRYCWIHEKGGKRINDILLGK